MRKIASPQDLQHEIQLLITACDGPDRPHRDKLATALRGLADRVGGGTLPELVELGEALTNQLSIVQKWKGYPGMPDGIDVFVQGDPVFIEWNRSKGYQRVDFSITVPLGKTIRDAVRAFGKMIKTDFDRLKEQYGRRASDRQAGRFVMPRSSYLPPQARDTDPVIPKGTDMAVWTWDETDRTGKPAFYGIAFAGKAQKPLWHHRFRDESQRQRQIDESASSRRAHLQRVEERAKERREFQHGLEKGSVLYSSWGYDQTNVNYYEVTAVKGKMVVIREIGSKTVREQRGADYVSATPGRFVGKPLRRKPQPGGSSGVYVKINSVQHAYPWDGKPKYETASGYGH